jgi:hypothetical protein
MKLIWTINSNDDFKNYTIFISTVQGSLGTIVTSILDKSITSYTVTGLTAETTYYFNIRVSDTGSLYKDSNIVTGKTVVAPSFPWILVGAGLITLTIATILIYVVRRRGKSF